MKATGHDIVAIVGQSNSQSGGIGKAVFPDKAPPAGSILQIYEPTKGDIKAVARDRGSILRSYLAPGIREKKLQRTKSRSAEDYTKPSSLVGPSFAFARHYVARALGGGERALAFTSGFTGGGSSLQMWSDPPAEKGVKGTDNADLLLRTVKRVQWALDNLPGENRVTGLIIQNGESDIAWIAQGRLPEDWLVSAQSNLINNFRKYFGEVPATIGECTQSWLHAEPQRLHISNTQRKIPETLPRVAFVSSEGLQCNLDVMPDLDPNEIVNFSAQAQIELGIRHCEALLAL